MNFRRANKTEIGTCTDIIKDAFYGYEFFEVYVDDPQQRRLFFETMMEGWMESSSKKGTVLIAEQKGEITAVAVLKEPDGEEIDLVDLESPQSSRMIAIGGRQNVEQFKEMCEISDKACRSLPDPKWHLVLLAVPKKWGGQGIGSRMLQEGILPYIASCGGGLLTFNTNVQKNRLFYKKNGFEEFEGEIIHRNGKEVGNWSYKIMVREK
ncbi:MAG: GNAT family N-acetyltransferase [Lachnospiraceae bacterium]|nr:GNAT family N-acetyltransferase [Robinsoniella sp.]MDY3767442.1 GNAT family N-acetyltransferase [Lachnospiraceae bacterium]